MRAPLAPPPFHVPLCDMAVRAGVWVSAAPRLSLGGCWGVCVLVGSSRVVSCTSWLGLRCGGACLCARPACSPPFLAGVRCVGVHAGPESRLCPALLGLVVGVCFLRFFFGRVLVGLCGVRCWLSLSRALWSLSHNALSFWLGCWLFFFFQRGVCLLVSVSLFLVGRCSSLGVADFGWVVPLCLFKGPVFDAFCLGGLAASCGVGRRFGGCGLFSRPPLLPPCFFSGGGPACSSLCLPWAGARTGRHSVLSSGLLLAVAFCLAVFRPHGSGGPCTRWALRPFLPG